jgi:4-carboxymuconolactone decarboxylase
VNDELFARGLAKRRQVLGAEYVDRAMEGADDFTRGFQRFMTEYCWGGVWCGTALDDRQRSLNNLSILATLGRMEEFELHFRGALRNGCTLEEVRETLVQVMVYAGVPAGVSAFRSARKVLAEEGVDTSQRSR